MMIMRNGAGVLLCLGIGLALGTAGCQWISGLDEIRVDTSRDEDTTSSGAGGAGGSQAAGGMGGTPISSGGTTSGGGTGQFGVCAQLDLPSQLPTICSDDTGASANISFLNECDLNEIIEVFWIPFDNGSGFCEPLKSYGLLEGTGATFSLSSGIGHRWRFVEQKSGRVLKDDVIVQFDGEVLKVP